MSYRYLLERNRVTEEDGERTKFKEDLSQMRDKSRSGPAYRTLVSDIRIQLSIYGSDDPVLDQSNSRVHLLVDAWALFNFHTYFAAKLLWCRGQESHPNSSQTVKDVSESHDRHGQERRGLR